MSVLLIHLNNLSAFKLCTLKINPHFLETEDEFQKINFRNSEIGV
jgi:peptidase E